VNNVIAISLKYFDDLHNEIQGLTSKIVPLSGTGKTQFRTGSYFFFYFFFFMQRRNFRELAEIADRTSVPQS